MLGAVNTGDAHGYGDDPWSKEVSQDLCARFGAADAYFVFNGSGANVVGLSLLVRPYEAVICAESAHLNTDECGAPERLLGTKLLTVATPDGKLTPDLVAPRLGVLGDEHRAQPRVVCITQATELGTCYSLAELAALGEFCRAHRLRLYLDGARLANAAAYLGCSLADLAAQADVLSFGGTKNGAVAAEAVIVMNPDLTGAQFQRKQLLQLGSKMRFLAAQFAGLLQNDIWLANATQANAMAQRLSDGLREMGVTIRYPVESNAVFAELDPRLIEPLQREWGFYLWDEPNLARLMTAFDSTPDDVDAFLASLRTAALSRV